MSIGGWDEGTLERFVQDRVPRQAGMTVLDSATQGSVRVSTSSAAEGPSAVSADLPYTACEVTLSPGVWLVYAQATLIGATATDGKQLALYDPDAAAVIAGSYGPVADSVVAVYVQAATLAVVVATGAQRVRMVALRNGASQISVGYAGALTDEQRIMAVALR